MISVGVNSRIFRPGGVLRIWAGGGVPVAPVVALPGSIDEQPLVGRSVLLTEPSVTGATSTAYQWYRGAPPTTPISGATSAAYTAVVADYGLTLYRRGTYTNATGSTVEDMAAPSVTGRQFSEDFSGMTVGDTDATVNAYGWASTSIDLNVITEAEAPRGKALTWSGTGASDARYAVRSDADTWSASYSTDPTEVLWLLRVKNTDRWFFRPSNNDTPTGLALGAGFGLRLGVLLAQLPGDDPNLAAGVNLGTLTNDQYVWCKVGTNGTLAQYKYWDISVSEPVAWTNRTHSGSIAMRGPLALGNRTGSTANDSTCLYMSSGHNCAAPFPTDFELPLPSSVDAMSFAAASTQTSFVQNALITWNFTSAPQGRYANGDPFILSTGAEDITSIAPASADVSGRRTNGAVVDYGEGAGTGGPVNQGFDGYVPSTGIYIGYDAALNVDPGKTGSALSFAAGAEGSILKAVSTTTPSADGRDRINFIGVMTVCAAAPPTNAFRPGVSAPSKISQWIEDDLDPAQLRNLTTPASAPSASNHLSSQRWPLQAWSPDNSGGRTIRGNLNHDNYGPDIQRNVATAILLCHCDIDSTVKRNLDVAVVQRGLDIAARVAEGGNWLNGGGGVGNGRKLALAYAAHRLQDATLISYCDESIYPIWTEDDAIRTVSAADVAAYDYEASDEGMSDWWDATPTRLVTNPYRAINTMWQPGAALAMMLTGGKTTWAKDGLFDYVDRIMERTLYDGSGTIKWATTLTGGNSPPQFHRDMWTNFRTAAGMPAVWNW